MNWRNSLVVVFLCLFVVSAAHADIKMTVTPSLAPNVYGSSSWGDYVTNAIYAIENGLSSYGDPTQPTYYQADPNIDAAQGLVTSFNSWMGVADPGGAFAGEDGNRMHFGLDIVASGGQTFSLAELSYSAVSTDPLTIADPSNGLDDSWGAGTLTEYSSYRVGLIHNADGTVTVVDSGPSSRQVDQLIYVGAGDAFWPGGDLADPACTGCTTAQKQAYIDDVATELGAYTYTGTYELQDNSGRVIASGSGAFDVSAPEPSAIVLLAFMLGVVGLSLRRRVFGRSSR